MSEKQHYVPQGYLRFFSTQSHKNMVWEHHKKKESKSRKISVKSICHIKNYYNVKDGQDNTLERMLASIESKGISVIRNIKSTCAQNYIAVTDHDKRNLAIFVAVMLTRNPSYRDIIHDFHESIALHSFKSMLRCSDVLDSAPNNVLKEIEKAGSISDFVDNNMRWEIDTSVSLRPMLLSANLVFHKIISSYWQFHRPTSSNLFWTSDNPVIVNPTTHNAGPSHPKTEILFPLRKDLFLVVTFKNPEPTSNYLLFHADASTVAQFNNLTKINAIKSIYSSTEKIS